MRENEHLFRRKIDKLYLDNTFFDPRFQIPSQEEAIQQIVSVIRDHPNHNVFLGIDTLGKEELLVQLAQIFNTKIVVDVERMKLLNIIGNIPLHLFETDQTKGFIIVKPKQQVTHQRIASLNDNNQSTIGIVPSGWAAGSSNNWTCQHYCPRGYNSSFSRQNYDETTRYMLGEVKQLVFNIPYSLHSSYTEIIEFVSILRPRQIYPLTYCKNFPIELLQPYLDPTESEIFVVPDAIYSNSDSISTAYEKGHEESSQRNSIETMNEESRKTITPDKISHSPNWVSLLSNIEPDDGDDHLVLTNSHSEHSSNCVTSWKNTATRFISHFYPEVSRYSNDLEKDQRITLSVDISETQLEKWSRKMNLLLGTSKMERKFILKKYTKEELTKHSKEMESLQKKKKPSSNRQTKESSELRKPFLHTELNPILQLYQGKKRKHESAFLLNTVLEYYDFRSKTSPT